MCQADVRGESAESPASPANRRGGLRAPSAPCALALASVLIAPATVATRTDAVPTRRRRPRRRMPRAVPASADAGAAAAGDAGAKHEHGELPDPVAGADVAIKDVEGGVEVSIRARTTRSTKEIRARMKKLADAAEAAEKSDAGARAKHDPPAPGEERAELHDSSCATRSSRPPRSRTARRHRLAKDKTELDWLRRETKDATRKRRPRAEGQALSAWRMPRARPGRQDHREKDSRGRDRGRQRAADRSPTSGRARSTRDVAKQGRCGEDRHSAAEWRRRRRRDRRRGR